MSGLYKLAILAALLLFAFVFFLNLIVPPWRTEIPLVGLEVPTSSRPVAAIPAKGGAAAGRSVLLVTIDTVRPDRLGYHGNRGIDTPTLDRLAREGVIFSRAVATATSTLPTHASILTGLYPHRHGAPANGVFRLSEGVMTLSESLARSGYDTAAFVSAFVLDKQFGLSRGFDVYDDQTDQSGGAFSHDQRRADRSSDRAIRWLRKSRAHPFFLWVHYYDPHAHYAPPEEYDLYPLLYDGELAFTDVQLGRVVGAARKAAGGDLLIAVTADHGEAFGEQGEDNHSMLVQEATLRIPLILHAPGAIPGGVHVSTRVSQIDIMPTILSLLGESIPADLDGVDLSAAPDPGRAIMAETIEGQVSFGWARLSALYQGRWKLVDGPNPELYDLEKDPLARENLSADRPEQVARLQEMLGAMRPGSPAQLPRHSLNPEDLRRLKALGYLRPGSEGAPSVESGIDPATVMPLLTHVDKLVSLVGGEIPLVTRLSALREGIWLPRQGEELIASIEDFAESHPEFAPTFLFLQDLYRERGRLAEAKAAQKRFRALSHQGRGAD